MPRSPRHGAPSHIAAHTLAQARRRTEQRPRDPQAWKDLGNQQLHSDPEQALASFERALQLLPDEPQALEWVAKAAQKLGQADRALELVHKALGIDPDFSVGNHRLETLYF